MDNYVPSLKACWYAFLGMIIALLIGAMLSSCTTTKIVTVPEVHTEYIHTVDSVHHTDSIIHDRETTIMKLDSAAMAKYGIQLQRAEQAWLVKTRELEYQLQRISQMKADTVIKTDSIPVPYPVEKKLSFWQKAKINYSTPVIIVLILIVIILIVGKDIGNLIKRGIF